MKQWFYQPEITFQMWQASHLVTLGLILLFILSFYLSREKLIPYRRPIRLTIGWALLLSRLSLDLWYITTKQWTAQSSLPLELCSIASIASGIMLLTKNRHLFEIFYFIGIGGAMQAVLTPDLDFGFPQYRYLQFFIDHSLLLIAPLVMIWLYRYTLTIKSFLKSWMTLHFLAAFVFSINFLLDANYMFLRRKPIGGSLLDFLGPYPYYLFALEGVVLVIFFLLYLPFLGKKQKQ